MAISTLSVPDVVLELSFVNLSISPGEFSPTILKIIFVLAFKGIAIAAFPHSSTLPQAFDEISFITASVDPLVDTFAIEAAIIILSHIYVSID